MSNIALSAAVRSNLLSLQNTAALLDTTQTRLATGNKVNSALDNPTSYFTASALNSRASDLGNLLDSVSNAIQTIQAANDGITSITKLVESAQATANQAQQLAATVTTTTAATAGKVTAGSFTNVNVSGTGSSATSATLSSSGFTALNLTNAGQTATASEVDAAGAFTDIDLSNNADNTYTFDVTFGSDVVHVSLGQSDAGVDNKIQIGEAVTAIQAQLDAYNSGAGLGVTVGQSGGKLTFTADTAGATALTVDNVATAGTGNLAATSDLGISNPTTTGQTDTGLANVTADSVSFDLTVGSTTHTITLDSSTAASNHGAVTAAEVAAAINTQFGSSVADGSSGEIVFTDPATGTGSHVQIASFATTGNATTSGLADGNDTGSAAGAADSLSFTVNVDGAGAQTVTLSSATVTAYNSANSASLSASSLTAANVAAIANYQLGATVASVSGGALVFTSGTTGTSSTVAVSAVTAAGSATNTTGITSANGTGSAASTASTANPARAALVDQYNGLLDQIDALTADAGYNGNNLLAGTSSQLKVVFNETGTSSLTITGKDTTFTGLGLAKLASGDFDTNTNITSILSTLKSAQDTLRADASSFGSNLSIVQTRQDFTKALINTLQTGAANLTLADSNEEAANLLALQTRQSLSTKALSLASQSDQNVLRLLQ